MCRKDRMKIEFTKFFFTFLRVNLVKVEANILYAVVQTQPLHIYCVKRKKNIYLNESDPKRHRV